MNKKYDVIVADSSGNITIMVLTPTAVEDYSKVAQKLLAIDYLHGEQVAFLIKDNPNGSFTRMDMCGLEFCGNASRSFALLISQSNKHNEITVNVSGCDNPLNAYVDHETNVVTMDMPIPTFSQLLSESELGINSSGIIVNLDGISHLILKNVLPSSETFDILRENIYKNISPNTPALGVMFYDDDNKMMTPVVYVKSVDTTYFEGSCASGTVAASYAMTKDYDNGEYFFELHQPGGILETKVIRKSGQTEHIYLSGQISLSEVISVEID